MITKEKHRTPRLSRSSCKICRQPDKTVGLVAENDDAPIIFPVTHFPNDLRRREEASGLFGFLTQLRIAEEFDLDDGWLNRIEPFYQLGINLLAGDIKEINCSRGPLLNWQ